MAQPALQIHRAQHGLDAHEPHRRRRLDQAGQALHGGPLILDRHPQPDIRERPVVLIEIDPGRPRSMQPPMTVMLPSLYIFQHAFRPLGQDHKRVLAGHFHHPKYMVDKLIRYIRVKEIRHRINEYPAGLLPLQREFEHMRLQGQIESVGVIPLPHRLEPVRHPLSVAMLAARTDLRAACDPVPGCVRPLNA